MARMLRVEDLFLLDDLRSLAIPWIDRLTQGCVTYEDVERVWNVIRWWGPDEEEVWDIASNAEASPLLQAKAAEFRQVVRLMEGWAPRPF